MGKFKQTSSIASVLLEYCVKQGVELMARNLESHYKSHLVKASLEAKPEHFLIHFDGRGQRSVKVSKIQPKGFHLQISPPDFTGYGYENGGFG